MQISSGGGSSSSSSSRSNVVVSVVELTEDLILEICSRLHPVSLLRFKSVSKKWYSLISNPHFLRRHTLVLHHHFHSRRILLHRFSTAGPGNSKILLILPSSPPPPQNEEEEGGGNDDDDDDDDDDDFYRKLSPLVIQKLIDYPHGHIYDKTKFMLVDSCNGLLLYTYHSFKYQILKKPPICYVCNPITNDYIKLIPTLLYEPGLKIHCYSSPNLVFQPSSLSLTFKVVKWLTCHNLEKQFLYRLYVYSSETRSWRLSISINELPVAPSQFNFEQRGVLCNGVLYWSSLKLCYDVEKDRVSTLKFPNLPVGGYTNRSLFYFGECGGRLRLIEHFYKNRQHINSFLSIFDVMELNEDDQQEEQQEDAELWTLKYRVNIGDEGFYADLIRNCSRGAVNILDLYKAKTKKAGEEEEEEVMLLRIGDICIIPFNVSSNTFGKELQNENKKPVISEYFFNFTEVLRYNTITLFPPSSS